MTNPDRSELVKLADELIAQDYGNVRDADAMEEHFVLLAKAATALRRLASSNSGVKVRELVWSPHPAGGEQALAAGLGLYRVHRDGSNWYLVPDHMGEGGKAAAQADYEARIRSALVEAPTVKGEPEPVADWRDDPTSDERWNAGCDFAMTQLCKALDVDPAAVNWDAATETVDGDVQSVIWNILRARMGEDWDPATAPPERDDDDAMEVPTRQLRAARQLMEEVK